MKLPPLAELLLKNVYFDTCVYHQPGIDCMTKVIPSDNILFASEMVGAVKGIDPETGNYFDDTRRYIDNSTILSASDKKKIYESNALKVYPRLAKQMQKQGIA
jgi:4-oxalmesaconate hydratase